MVSVIKNWVKLIWNTEEREKNFGEVEKAFLEGTLEFDLAEQYKELCKVSVWLCAKSDMKEWTMFQEWISQLLHMTWRPVEPNFTQSRPNKTQIQNLPTDSQQDEGVLNLARPCRASLISL